MLARRLNYLTIGKRKIIPSEEPLAIDCPEAFPNEDDYKNTMKAIETYLSGPESAFRRAQGQLEGVTYWKDEPLPEEALLKSLGKTFLKRKLPIFGEVRQNAYGPAWIVLYHYSVLDAVRTYEQRLVDTIAKTEAKNMGLLLQPTMYPLIYTLS
jgi:hypothetical protein